MCGTRPPTCWIHDHRRTRPIAFFCLRWCRGAEEPAKGSQACRGSGTLHGASIGVILVRGSTPHISSKSALPGVRMARAGPR